MSKTIEIHIDLNASPEAVFAALTDANALEAWFAERAEVDLNQGRYAFWGRYTPEAPAREAARQQLIEAQSPQALCLGWRVRGGETTVAYALQPQGRGTRLRLCHEGLPPWRKGEYSFSDFWSMALENLRTWLDRGVVGARCEFDAPRHGDIRLDIEIDAPPEHVFKALTDPKEMERYIAQQATVELKVGGRYSFGWESGGPIKILDLVPNELLSYSWRFEREGEPETAVTWELAGSGGKTRLTLVHSGFDPAEPRNDYGVGWMGFLVWMKSMLESGPGWKRAELRSVDYGGEAA